MKNGKVLWWDNRDKNGVLEDISGNRFYFDSSVIDKNALKSIRPGAILFFEVNSSIDHTPCAHNVSSKPKQISSNGQKKQNKTNRMIA